MPALPPLQLITFGAPTARLSGEVPPPDVLWRKHLALLIYLALSPGMVRSREHLLGLLWPDKDDAKARHSLNEALRRLRASLGADRIITQGDSVGLAPGNLEIDALAVSRRAGPSGVFLEGFTLDDAPAFEDWAESARTRFRAQATRSFVEAAQELLALGKTAEAWEAARRALGIDQYAEPAVRLAMRAAALGGDQSGALHEFHRFTEKLDQLGERPSQELSALAQRIREGRWLDSAGRPVDEPPLVGRAAVLQELARWLSPGPRGATLLFEGEPGIGKTRLFSEAVLRLALEGAAACVTRPIEADQTIPWSTLRSVVRRGLVSAPGIAATDPGALAVLAAVVPELASRVAPREPRDQGEIALALGMMLRAITEEVPVVIGVDQAHFADDASLGALRAAMEGLTDTRAFLLLTAVAGDPDTPRQLIDLQAQIGRALPGRVVTLGELDATAMTDLVTAMAPWCAESSARNRLARRLLVETAGRPLLAVAMLRSLSESASLRERAVVWPPPEETFESLLPVEIPQLVKSTVLAQIARIDAKTRILLAAAAIGNRVLDLTLVAGLAGDAAGDLPSQMAKLEQHHLVMLEGDRYAFATPLIQTVVERGMLTAGQMRDLRRRAVELLTGRADLASRVLRAELQVRLSPTAETCAGLLEVAADALAAGDRRTARRCLVSAETSGAELRQADRAILATLRARLDAGRRNPVTGAEP
jgi:DNA-binding SARP family transcriptional activator